MNEIERISKALEKSPELKEGARAALDIFRAAVSGNTGQLDASFNSWAELDDAFSRTRLEQVSSTSLRRLFELAVAAAIKTVSGHLSRGGD